jgi:short-subunit dehydrogenase
MDAEVLKDRWALVTGASSGLGADIARELASIGCNLVLTARRADRLNSLLSEIRKRDRVQGITIPMDLSTKNAPQDLYQRVQTENINIDVLVNNAGFGIMGEFTEIDWERENEMLQLNMISLVHITKLFIQDMVAREFGYILQIASNSAYQPSPLYATYGASKSFVLNFSEALNYELKDTNIKSTVFSPGTIETEFHTVSGQRTDTLYYAFSKMDSKVVARAGINAMLKGRPSLAFDWKISLAAWISWRIPRRWAAGLAFRLVQQ